MIEPENICKPEAIILSLDLGTKMGWALGVYRSFMKDMIDYGTFKLDKKLKKTHNLSYSGAFSRHSFMKEEMFNFLDEKIKDITYEHDTLDISDKKSLLLTIAYEKVVAHKGTIASHMWAYWESVIMDIFNKYRNDIKICIALSSVGTIKKHWTGKGNANKEMMIDEAKKRGYDVQDDNQADALALLDLIYNKEYKNILEFFDIFQGNSFCVG